jgi:hypothetical protein
VRRFGLTMVEDVENNWRELKVKKEKASIREERTSSVNEAKVYYRRIQSVREQVSKCSNKTLSLYIHSPIRLHGVMLN